MKITWSISSTSFEKQTGAILNASWSAQAEDSVNAEQKYFSYISGATSFDPNAQSQSFIPYPQVTEQDVLSWVWSVVSKEEVEAGLVKQIEEKKNPITATGLPWQSAAAN